MTEADAKTKWCPFTQVAAAQGTGSAIAVTNRGRWVRAVELTPAYARCLGADCVAWHLSVHGVGRCNLIEKG